MNAVKLGRIYPEWYWWILDKIARLFYHCIAIRGDGWSCLYWPEEREELVWF